MTERNVITPKNIIFTSEWHAKHQFAGQIKQHAATQILEISKCQTFFESFNHMLGPFDYMTDSQIFRSSNLQRMAKSEPQYI